VVAPHSAAGGVPDEDDLATFNIAFAEARHNLVARLSAQQAAHMIGRPFSDRL
jgi:hypothetical protein